jgi:glycosyltransferase involved in cell wall biosynthesis
MKVIHVLNHFLPQQTAGTEIYTWALSRQLQQLGVEVKVLIPHYGQMADTHYVYDGIPVRQYAEPTVEDRALIMGFREPDGLKNYTQFLLNEQPDIVHFHELAAGSGINLAHIKAAKKSGAKVIMTFHLAGYSCKTGTLVYKGRELCNGVINLKKCSICYLHSKGYSLTGPLLVYSSALMYQLNIDTSKCKSRIGTAFATVPLLAQLKKNLHDLVDSCDRVVSITHWYKRVLLENGVQEEKISFIPTALPFSIQPSLNQQADEPRPLRILFLGRINPFKGLHLLLEAIRFMDEKSIELDIYGQSSDPDYEEQCRLLVKDKSNIHWKGLLEQKDVVTTMRRYHALCLCSTFSEMAPLVIQEAYAAGIPVIASHVHGNAEQINHGDNGLLFRYNDVDSLRQQFEKCIADTGLLKRLAQKIQSPADFSAVAGSYHQLYKKLISAV